MPYTGFEICHKMCDQELFRFKMGGEGKLVTYKALVWRKGRNPRNALCISNSELIYFRNGRLPHTKIVNIYIYIIFKRSYFVA
jgi:hypothetical protein